MEVFSVETWLENGFVQNFFDNFRTIVPGKVVSFSNNTATIEIAIQETDDGGNPIQGSMQLYQVPCLMVGGQQNYMTCELSANDYGLLLVCDRDIDNFKAVQGSAVINSNGVANLKDSIFIAGLFLPASSGVKLFSATQIDAVVGSSQVQIMPNQITELS